MKKLLIVLSIMIGLFCQSAMAGIGGLSKSGTTAAQFLKIQVGARAIGMGGAYVALSNDAMAAYWNPAGLTEPGSTGTVSFVHTNWLADTYFNFASITFHAGSFGTLGLSFTSLGMSDMEVRTEFEPEGTGEFFSALDMSIGLSYAKSLTDRFSLGLTAKYIHQQIWHMTASTIAFDIGLLFRTDFDWLTLGISIANFGPKLQYAGKDVFINYDYTANEFGDSENIFANLQTDSWDLPLLFRFGLAFEILNDEHNQLLATIEARHPNDNSENISLGAEYGFMQRFFLRGGYQALFEKDSEKGLTAGAGFIYYLNSSTKLIVDYAFAEWNRLNNVHHFSIQFYF